MSTKTKTLLAGLTTRIGSFLALWATFGGQWSTQVLGIFPPTWRPATAMTCAVLTFLAGVYKTLLDAHGNERAKTTAILTGTETPPNSPQ